jgi:hypothetical protein
MNSDSHVNWCPFRPGAQEMEAIDKDVAEVGNIQQTIVAKNKQVQSPDRVAHQYQIAGSKVLLKIAEALPVPLQDVGLFHPGAEHIGIGRISTGLGTPHIETNPDFLGIMVAFQSPKGRRVDFLAINDPTSPTDNHKDFINVLHATGESAGAEVPFVGDLGSYDAPNLIAEQAAFGLALKDRMGWIKAGKTLSHLTKQTLRTFHSSTAYQTYWTGIEEIGGTAGKFTFVPAQDENRRPEFRPGERHLSEEWKMRQRSGDVEFRLYWIPFLNEDKTPTKALTDRWEEDHKQLAGMVLFPRSDPDSEEAILFGILASEMGANPGNWIHDKEDTIREPATEFGTARKLAYQISQAGRGALEPDSYKTVFETGKIGPDLAEELRRRRDSKVRAGHIGFAF